MLSGLSRWKYSAFRVPEKLNRLIAYMVRPRRTSFRIVTVWRVCCLTYGLFVQWVLLPMMAIRGWGSYLRDVLEVLAIHRSFPTRFDRHSITSLSAGSPSKRVSSVVVRHADGSGSYGLQRVPSALVEGQAPG